MKLRDVGSQAPQLARQGRQQRVADGRLGGHQDPELIPRQGQGLRRFHGNCARRTRRSIEQRKLTEEIAAAQRGQDRLLTVLRRHHDLDSSACHDKESVPGIALVKQNLATAKASSPQSPGQCRQRLPGHAVEQPAAPQRFRSKISLQHAAIVATGKESGKKNKGMDAPAQRA